MTKEEILKIAKEYDLIAGNAEHGISTMGIVNFAILIANYEREACAKLCEKQMEGKSIWIEGSRACSIAIRAREQK
jgi:hypothetical protein